MAFNMTHVEYILTMHNGPNASAVSTESAEHLNDEDGSEIHVFNTSHHNNLTSSTEALTAMTTTLKSIVNPSSDTGSTSPWPVGSSSTTAGPLAQHHDMAPLGLLTILILAVIGNITVCLVVRIERHLHHMTYYFFVSLAVVHLLMVAIVMPPAILVILAGKYFAGTRKTSQVKD